MPEVSSYRPGMPCWAELATPDINVSKAFYGGLFGWCTYTITSDRLGEYVMFTLGVQGPEVGGLAALADDTEPPTWTCYFSVPDAQAAAGTVRTAGGQVFLEGTDIGHMGRMALVGDTQGAGFGLWQPSTFHGAGVLDEPATMCSVELACRDAAEAHRFYRQVLGWRHESRTHLGVTHTDWWLGDRPIAGMVVMNEHWPARNPAHWIPYFAVADCDASVARATALGAEVPVPPADTTRGRFCVMTDPTGARLALITPAGADATRPRVRG